MIYWQALKLRIKGATLYVHPAKRKPKMIGDKT